MSKICPKCGIEFEAKSKYESYCPECRRIYQRTYGVKRRARDRIGKEFMQSVAKFVGVDDSVTDQEERNILRAAWFGRQLPWYVVNESAVPFEGLLIRREPSGGLYAARHGKLVEITS